MVSASSQRPFRIGLVLVAQAALWIVLTLAFAALIQLAGWSSWPEALTFSATNWLPWMLLAPAVFWLARRFPFERGHLWRAVPIHLLACAACSFAFLSLSSYYAPWPRGLRPPGGAEMRSPGWERREVTAFEATGGGSSPRDGRDRVGERPRFERPERGVERPGGPGRGADVLINSRGDVRVERPPGERWSRDARIVFRGGFPPSPGTTRGFIGRFWPPFSGIALRANVSAAVYLIIACFAHAFAYYRRAQEREGEAAMLAAGLARAKLDALRLQLQPHFLFNTLNAISTLVHRDAKAADELIGDLSELLRLSLQTTDHEVPLSRELELLDCYLAIEQARLGERLRIIREIDPAAESISVPTFLLQPLAENAIRHGIEPRLAPGTVTIRADVVGGNLRLVVSDDGVGLKATAANSNRRGIGISNTEQRLRALYGDAAQLDFFAPETGGVQVQVVLPIRMTAGQVQSPE